MGDADEKFFAPCFSALVFIRVHLCASVFKFTNPAPMQGFLSQWTATVSETVSMAAD